MDKGTILQHRATILPNIGITYISGITFVRATERILPRIEVAGQDNITYDGTCPGRMKGGIRTCSHTYTPTTLIVQLCYYMTYN